ncbi:glycosyltransferase [Microbulbifer thermotolerans]|uniref:glycosyltransferase n=1 Tax=Microbulbifer thermotolerans TaxID=252514 RepID=UPI00224B064E|nr:glycosyltransferase [Microbulbifer thermotolerans]MCX2784426.1 glycosyltransferase [Microbulbifer thermotolerans]
MRSKFQILHCYRTFYPESQGGVEQVILEIAQKVDNSCVLTLSDRPARLKLGGEVDVVAKKRWCSFASCCIGPGLLSELYRLHTPLLHFHYPWPFGDLAYFLAGRSRPLVITYHSDIVRQRLLGALYRPLMHRLLSQADRIVATSQNYVDSSPVLAAYKDKVKIIPIGISEQEYPQPTDDQVAEVAQRYGRDFMLFVGVLRYYKGLEYLIRASVGQPYRVVIAGRGPELRRLMTLVKDLRAQNVAFAGFVSDVEKGALMRLCRAVVFPSHLRSEAFGVTLLEGLMYGKPLISCEIGTGTSFVNVDGETGHVVPPANPAALREAMNDLWLNPDKAERMGWAGRQRYEKLFTGERMAAAYRKLYDEVLSERGLAR